MRILLIVAVALAIVDDLVRSKMHKKYILIIMSLTFMLVFKKGCRPTPVHQTKKMPEEVGPN